MKLILLLPILVFTFYSYSQNTFSTETKGKKSYLLDDAKWTIAIPIWIPGYYGKYDYGDIDIEGESGPIPTHPIEPGEPSWQPGDILSRVFKTENRVNFFFLNSIAYQKNKLYTDLDWFYGSIDNSLLFTFNNSELVQAKVSATLVRLIAGYQLYEWNSPSAKAKYKLYGIGGVRWQQIKVKSDLNNIINHLDIAPLWIEPIICFRNELSFEKWKFVVQADVGSFNINEKLSYMINAYSYYRMSKLLSLQIGWTDWDIKYSDYYLGKKLNIKMHLSGPSTAIIFHF